MQARNKSHLYWLLEAYCMIELSRFDAIFGPAKTLKHMIKKALRTISHRHSAGLHGCIPTNLTGKSFGYFPLTADPMHWEHLTAVLLAISELSLDCVVIQVNGTTPNRKPNKSSLIHRHTMAQLATAPFWPIIRYTLLGYDDTRTGGELLFDFAREKKLNSVVYLTGADDLAWKAENLKKGVAKNQGSDLAITVALSCRETLQKAQSLKIFENVVERVLFIDGPKTGISSSAIREGDLPIVCPIAVEAYIRRNGLYGYKR